MQSEGIMRLFHAGYRQIEHPDVHYGRKNADFGQGFYLSDSEEFAGRWTPQRKGETVFINVYDFDPKGLNIVRLSRDETWLNCISQNRVGRDPYPDADVLIGPIANDTIFDTLGILTSGLIAPSQALRLFSVGPCYTQIALKSKRAEAALRFVDAYTPSEEALSAFAEAQRRDAEGYMNALSEALSDVLGADGD